MFLCQFHKESSNQLSEFHCYICELEFKLEKLKSIFGEVKFEDINSLYPQIDRENFDAFKSLFLTKA